MQAQFQQLVDQGVFGEQQVIIVFVGVEPWPQLVEFGPQSVELGQEVLADLWGEGYRGGGQHWRPPLP